MVSTKVLGILLFTFIFTEKIFSQGTGIDITFGYQKHDKRFFGKGGNSGNNGITNVTVALDINEDFLDYMNETYPKALDKLKELCEK